MNISRLLMIVIAAASVMEASTTCAASPPAAPITEATTDQQTASGTFVRKATQDGMLEVEAGKLAVSKTANADIKAFAQRMIVEHGATNLELQTVIGQRYEVPTKLDADHQAKLELLMSKTGADFDRAYSTEMIQGHRQAIKLFTEASNDAALNADLQQFARKTLPTLHQHQMQSMKLPGDTAE